MTRNIIVAAMAAALLLASCGEKKKTLGEVADQFRDKPEMTLSSNDTATVKALAQEFIGNLQEGRFREATSMIYYLNGDTIEALGKEQAALQAKVLRSVHGVKYEIDNIVFKTEKDSQVKYTVTLFEPKPGDSRPNTISCVIKPVRRDGKWFLTMADTMSDTNGTQIEN